MEKSKEFIAIKYLSMVFLFLETFFIEDKNGISAILIFLYIINNQTRMYILNNNISRKISMIVDMVLILTLGLLSNVQVMACGIILMIDSRNIVNITYRKLFNLGIILASSTILIQNFSLSKSYRIFFLIIFSVIIEYIVRENKEKLNAQDLYYKLRVSEEELKKANKNLENYATTIEELTLLKERNRISREIHDSVGHALSTALIQLNAMEQLSIRNGDTTLISIAGSLRNFIKGSLDEVRMAVRKLKPSNYENYEGLIRIENLLKEFEKLTDIKVKLTLSKNKWTLNSNQSENLYRILQESLSNSIRHGKATEINILMNFDKDILVVNIKDNGMGRDEIIYSGLGLNNIKERISELKGEVYFTSEKGKGFNIKIIIPKTLKGEI
ncbi:sensor histidine kinase [Clostridium sp.]|uniref:sensor histidine kinase n=1 Tax=Clostridium sp. TaxID=1506 RepID=UPI003F2B9553